MLLSGRALAQHVQSPGVDTQHHEKKSINQQTSHQCDKSIRLTNRSMKQNTA
jgi:hypothetical protein